jgi:MoaA/NifB/PqqE/SkfB family radical SAM enzyme
MGGRRLFKSPDVLVLRRYDEDGLYLVNLHTGWTETIDAMQAKSWTNWPTCYSDTFQSQLLERLLSGKFVVQTSEEDHNFGVSRSAYPCDAEVPRINNLNARWYYESPDLTILFNTAPMAQINPLLALGPYGTLCWRGVEDGKSVRAIRMEAGSVFGRDEVLPFLRRLADLGFLMPVTGRGYPRMDLETITKEFPAPEVQWRLAQSVVPWYCLWEICTTCDLRCKICYLPDFTDPGPDCDEALKVARQIVDSNVFYLCLLGGEVLLRSDLELLIERIRAERVYVKIISNGIKLHRQRARALASAGLNQIEISFDGLSQEVHDGSRGEGTFREALHALYNARDAGIPRDGIVWTVHRDSFRELEGLPTFLHTHGVRECYISLFKKTGLMGAHSPFQPLDPRQVELLRTSLANWKPQYPELTIVLLPGCSCGRTSVVVGSNGDVRLCSFSYLPVGNVFRRPLLEVWQGLKAALPPSGPAGFCRADAVQNCLGSG